LDLGAGALTINSTQVTASSYFYFMASTGIYLQDPSLVALGDIGQVAAGGRGTLLEVDPVNNRTRIYNINASNTQLLVNGTINVTAGGTFGSLTTFTSGISAAGTTAATFSGTVNCNSSTVYKPTLQYYNEPTSSPSISSNVLTLDLSAAQVFTVSLNANINTFTISNTPATASRAMSFTLIFTADGTARTVTWGSSVKWANGTAPVLTSTNTKKDVFTFMTTDAGTSWLGFVAGQNF
jgi:hypothetical protein